jgi:hypothetical protein
MANAGEQTGGLREGGGRLPIRRILTVAGIIIVALLLGWWILASYANAARSSYGIASDIKGAVQLELLYPKTLLIDQQHELTIRFTTSQELTKPLEVALTLPPGIRATETPSDTLSADTTILFNVNEKGGQQSIPITNAGTRSGWRAETQTITVTSSLGHQFAPAPSVTIEGAGRGAARLTLTSTLDRNTPLLLAIAGLVALGTLLVNVYFQKRDDERDDQRLAKEKRDDEQERRQQLQTVSDAFCRCLREGDLSSAKRYHGQLKSLQSQTSADLSLDYDLLQRILDYAGGNFLNDPNPRNQLRSDLANNEYLAELAGALILAAPVDDKSLSNLQQEEARRIYLELSPERLSDAGQRQVYQNTLHRLFGMRLQAVRLDIPCPNPPPDPVPKTHLCPAERAQDECGLLSESGRQLFWDKNPEYGPILECTSGTVVVYSEPGSGRSALARHGLEHFTGENWFAVLIGGDTAQATIRQRMAAALLHYVGHKATLLLSLTDNAQRTLLANLLVEELGRDEVDACLAGFIHERPWMSESQSGNEQHRALWPKVGCWELELLRQAVAQADGRRRTDLAWFRAFGQWASWLKFKGIHVILDSDGWGLTSDSLRADLQCWQEAGLAVTLLLPRRSLLGLSNIPSSLNVQELTWKETELKELLDHRSRKLGFGSISQYFTKEALAAFLAAEPATPRQMGRVWRQLLTSNPATGRFEEKAVQAALMALAGRDRGGS